MHYGDARVERGSAGETQQVADGDQPSLTTQQGVVADGHKTLRVGERGPALLEDFDFREKLFHFDHELARDVRGFATKFYTREGNWDLVGNNIPILFIQDPIKFPDLVHAAK